MFSFILIFLPLHFNSSLFLLSLSPVSYACSFVSLPSVFPCLSESVSLLSPPHLPSPPLIPPPLQKHRPLVLRAPNPVSPPLFPVSRSYQKFFIFPFVFLLCQQSRRWRGCRGGQHSPQDPFTVTPGLMGSRPSLGSSCLCKVLKQREWAKGISDTLNHRRGKGWGEVAL